MRWLQEASYWWPIYRPTLIFFPVSMHPTCHIHVLLLSNRLFKASLVQSVVLLLNYAFIQAIQYFQLSYHIIYTHTSLPSLCSRPISSYTYWTSFSTLYFFPIQSSVSCCSYILTESRPLLFSSQPLEPIIPLRLNIKIFIAYQLQEKKKKLVSQLVIFSLLV